MNRLFSIIAVALPLAAREPLAQRIVPELESATDPALRHDSSTNNLIRRYRSIKQ